MACNCNNDISRSTATVAVSSTNLLITPTNELTPLNEGRVALMITNSVPADGMSLPVTVTINGSNIPVYDKYGNIIYGYGLKTNVVLKGYFGNNGAEATAHLQLINFPFYRCARW